MNYSNLSSTLIAGHHHVLLQFSLVVATRIEVIFSSVQNKSDNNENENSVPLIESPALISKVY